MSDAPYTIGRGLYMSGCIIRVPHGRRGRGYPASHSSCAVYQRLAFALAAPMFCFPVCIYSVTVCLLPALILTLPWLEPQLPTPFLIRPPPVRPLSFPRACTAHALIFSPTGTDCQMTRPSSPPKSSVIVNPLPCTLPSTPSYLPGHQQRGGVQHVQHVQHVQQQEQPGER